jgi:hypothetical protein
MSKYCSHAAKSGKIKCHVPNADTRLFALPMSVFTCYVTHELMQGHYRYSGSGWGTNRSITATTLF